MAANPIVSLVTLNVVGVSTSTAPRSISTSRDVPGAPPPLPLDELLLAVEEIRARRVAELTPAGERTP